MKKEIIVGGTLDQALESVMDVFRRVESGMPVKPRETITFESWTALAAIFSETRYELLQYLHGTPTADLPALARDLGRDDKAVQEDLTALVEAGLVDRDEEGRWRVDYDDISTTIRLHPWKRVK